MISLKIYRNMFPENVVQACSQQIGTSYKRVIKPRLNETLTQLNNGTKIFDQVEVLVREIKYIDGTNVMGLVVFCTIIGIFISHAKNEAQILYDFFFVMNELIMKIVALIMWYSPVGILFLVATNIVKIDNMAETAKRLSLYMVTVILGLLIHALFTIQMLYFLTTRKNPLVFLKGMLQVCKIFSCNYFNIIFNKSL
jgi:Na+/H+-dicarboxylate symporter